MLILLFILACGLFDYSFMKKSRTRIYAEKTLKKTRIKILFIFVFPTFIYNKLYIILIIYI
ncbi:hypothetical protein BU073_06850 [Mammaliicoccus vitulinus]|nr:hypothetical protein BU073_06850 [Mammaliicoccus vitulinus]